MDPADVVLVSNEGDKFPMTFVALAARFRMFSRVEMAGSIVHLDFSSNALRKLGAAMSDPHAPVLDEESARLLNHLGLNDFRDVYKLYKKQ